MQAVPSEFFIFHTFFLGRGGNTLRWWPQKHIKEPPVLTLFVRLTSNHKVNMNDYSDGKHQSCITVDT